jgi:hypothetical protein
MCWTSWELEDVKLKAKKAQQENTAFSQKQRTSTVNIVVSKHNIKTHHENQDRR